MKLKKAYTQYSFAYGQVRSEFLDADDLDLRNQSLQNAQNTQILATRTVKSRAGTFYKRTLSTAQDAVEIKPGVGLVYALILEDDNLSIIDANGTLIWSTTSIPWTSAAGIWVEPFRERTLIGSGSFLYVLTYDNGSWTFSPFQFDTSDGLSLAQPYWVFNKGVEIQPSATTGAINVTANSPIFEAGYVGLRIRYGSQEIAITEYVSPTLLRGNVISELPPSFALDLADASHFRVGDAVVAGTTSFEGVVISVSGTTINVVTTSFYDGPDASETLSSPVGSTTISSKTAISPLPSTIWDEPVMSDMRGWPRAAASAEERLWLVDFPQIPDLIVISSTRAITDMKIGAADSDGIARQVGENSPRILSVINSRDVVIFTDRGCYYIPLHTTQTLLTPSTFDIVLFDQRGASDTVRPVQVDDGVVFLEASGKVLSAALLQGTVYLRWSIVPISQFHSDLIKTPTKLCGPSLNDQAPEKYLFAINSDGTVAMMSWYARFDSDAPGFVPWNTQGSFVSMAPCFGGYIAIVDRSIAGTSTRFLESVDETAMLDCAVEINSSQPSAVLGVSGGIVNVSGGGLLASSARAPHLAGETVHIWSNNYYAGTFSVASDGTITADPPLSGVQQVGLNFQTIVQPWPRKMMESPRLGMIKARLVRCVVSLYETVAFTYVANATTRFIGSYTFGDDLSLPPTTKTQRHRFSVFGNRDHPTVQIQKNIPGPFQVLSITQEVQG